MTALRLGAVVAFVEAQERLAIAKEGLREAQDVYRLADAATCGRWDDLTAEEQAAVNAAYEPGGVEVTP